MKRVHMFHVCACAHIFIMVSNDSRAHHHVHMYMLLISGHQCQDLCFELELVE